MPQRVKIMTFKPRLLYSGSCNTLHLPLVTSSASLWHLLLMLSKHMGNFDETERFGFVQNTTAISSNWLLRCLNLLTEITLTCRKNLCGATARPFQVCVLSLDAVSCPRCLQSDCATIFVIRGFWCPGPMITCPTFYIDCYWRESLWV